MTRRATIARYAALGVPLGFLGLPLYMHLPHYYAQAYGFSLGLLGAVLMLGRLVDCLADPWIGRLLDGAPARAARLQAVAALAVTGGMGLLFGLPAWLDGAPPLWLLGTTLVVTYLGYSVLSIRFYARGVALAAAGQDDARISSWREGMVIAGVIVAAAAPGLGMPYPLLAGLFALLLVVALLLGRGAVAAMPPVPEVRPRLRTILRRHGRLYAVFFFNALAPAMTATLYLFYLDTVLVAPQLAAPCLLLYFAAAVAAMPLWVRAAARYGAVRCLLLAMLLAIASFTGAAMLGVGDVPWFALICVLTGIAFGADAALLPALLSGELAAARTDTHAAFGIWMAISKLTLALAAGMALPAVTLLEGAGMSDAGALRIAYGALPCAIKLMAFLCLVSYHFAHRRRTTP